MNNRKLFSGRLEAILVGAAFGCPLSLLLPGCSQQELVETNKNALDALIDATSAVASDPSQALTPAGLTVIGATFVLGFFSRQSASVAKWVASTTGGPLVKGLKKILPAKKPPQE